MSFRVTKLIFSLGHAQVETGLLSEFFGDPTSLARKIYQVSKFYQKIPLKSEFLKVSEQVHQLFPKLFFVIGLGGT